MVQAPFCERKGLGVESCCAGTVLGRLRLVSSVDILVVLDGVMIETMLHGNIYKIWPRNNDCFSIGVERTEVVRIVIILCSSFRY